MALTQEQIQQLRAKGRAWVAKQMPRAVREARRKSKFERVGGRLRLKSKSARRVARNTLALQTMSLSLCWANDDTASSRRQEVVAPPIDEQAVEQALTEKVIGLARRTRT